MKYWKEAQNLVHRVPSLSIGTTDKDGSPRVTPIGSLFLTEEGKGFYFEKLPQGLRENLDRDGRFFILAVRGGMLYWIKSLFAGKFSVFPALTMTGKAGPRRQCTPEERKCFESRFGKFKGTKGYDILWKDMQIVRELNFDKIEPSNLSSMTSGLMK